MDKQDIQEVHRLTPLQQGMLFHTLEAPGSGVYVEQFACPTVGRIDGARWQQAWNMALAAYPVLRAAIAWEGLDHPLLVVTKAATIEVREIDATGDDDAAFAARIDALRRAEAACGFDLRRPPLLRQALLHRQGHSVVFWTYHHVLLDGWSAFVVLGALLSAYAVLEEGGTWQPRPVPGWGDYLGWLRGRDKASAESYWREALRGFSAPTPLGLVRRPVADIRADAGTTATAELGEALGNRLRDTARALRVTPGTLLQAAWAHLLALYSGEDDVVFGATVAGRPPELAGADAMVGLFINTVPVRVRIDPTETVRAFATRLGAALVAQREHEHASLTDIAGWSEVPRGRVLFDSMLAIESFPYADGVSLADVSVWQHTSFPLALVIDPVGRMRIKALYDGRQFDGGAVAGLLDHYRELLGRMVDGVDLPVGMLSIAPAADMALQDGWNHRPAVNVETELGELFARQVAQRPDALALVAGEEQATYAELDLQARLLGARLQGAGVREGDTVAFAFEPGVPMIAALVAITRLGCAYAPLDTRLPAARLAQMVADLRIRHVVTDDAHAALFDIAGAPLPLTVLLAGRDEGDVPLAHWPRADAGRILYVIHTSGSTGKPKAAGVFHDSFTRFIGWWNGEFAFGAGERCLLVNKITFDLAQKCVWGALTTGGTLHLAPTRHFDPVHARELVQRHGIGWINCTPSMAYALVEADPGRHEALASLRRLFVGGEPVDKRRLAPWLLAPGCATELVNTYGPTECTDLCTTHRFTRDEFIDLDAPVTVGNVLPGLAVHVLDRFGNRLPVGVTGEVAIAGGSVGAGYLNNARMSATKFLPDPENRGARLYLTGDLGYFRADGTLVVHGRVDFQVKVRGYRIELDAIGHELRGHPAVLDAVAAVTPDGQRLVAYVVPVDGAAWSAALHEECRAWLAARLPEYMVPARYLPLAALPLNANGKLDRGALPLPDMADAGVGKIAPRDAVEEKLAGIWAAVLGVDAVGVTDNFFDLGGHSLSITQAYARLQKAFGVRIPLSVLFEQPTIEGQAAALRAAGANGGQAAARQPAIVSGPRPERLPLSFPQSRLWFLHQYDPASMAYHVPNALPLAGDIDRVAMQRALDWLHARHESLRTRFPEVDGMPWQEVLPAAPVTLGYDDLRGHADAAQRLSAIATAEAAQPFDLRAGPVARYRLVQTDGKGILLVSLHHIATDGWSMDVMMRELSAAYAAFAAGTAPQAAPLPIQYADYALWQHADLAGDKRGRLVDYWREELDGSQPQITLPYDLPRPATRSSSGGLHVSHLPADLCAAMRGVASASGATAFMAWLAVYDLLLYRWSGQADFNVGSPIANRNLEETEGVIGFFVNTLVLRARVDGAQTFAGLLGEVQRTARGAYDHAELPFELLVDELNPPRSANTLPFFQVGFALQRAYEDTSLIDSGEWISRFDLQLVLYESADGGLRAHWEYARDLFLPETVARLADSFALLARQVASAPDAPLRGHALIDGAQRERMLALARGVKPALPAATVHGLFAQQTLLAPAAVALVQGSVQLTYDELNRRANRLAHHLIAHGAAPGGIVGVALPRGPQLIAALLAVLKAGCAYLPLDTEYPRERTAYMLENAGACAVLTDGDGAALLPAFGGSVLAVDAPAVAGLRDTNPEVPHDPRSLAYVMYTSGTTGKPKGVMIEHRNIVRLVRETGYADFSALRTYLQYAPVGFDASTFEIWGSLLNGARLVQAPPGVVGLDGLAALIAGQRIDTVFVTAALFNQLVDQHPEGLAGVRQLFTGGEAMSSPHAARALQAMQAGGNGKLVHVYGPTECTTYATAWQVSMADALGGTVPIGRPIANTDTYVLDQALEPVPVGVPGELYIGGAGVARGYLHAPQQTAERFVADPFSPSGDGARLYRTGDKVRWKADGTLEFLGRMDDQVKVRGYRIEPAEIEAQLASYPGVGGALVLALGDSADKRLVAYATRTAGDEASAITPALLREYLAQRLPAFMVPGAYVMLERWPVTANGKIDRRALPAPDDAALGAGDYVAPETALEQSLAAVWAQVLGLERVSVTADFFALGGNSLTATQLLARARAALGRTVTLPEFFSEPTVRAMAFRIDHAGTARARDAAESRLDGAAESALALPEPLPPLASSLEHVLLTGATGFVGAYLAAEMLDRWPRVTLHCHVRAAHAAAGLRRLRDNLDQYGLWKEGYAARIRVLTGDLADPQLGLDDGRYATLARDIDLVVHNASRLNHVLPYHALRHDNVEPTRRLLELAATAKRKGFMHVSTAGVLQGERGGTFDEDAAVEDVRQSGREGYNASKWVAELMVRRAARAGIPAQIVRLGRVAVDSRSGAGRMDDFVALFVRTCLKVGAWPDRPFVEQIVPVDHVARAITVLAGDYTNTGVHHLVGDDKRDWSRLLPDFVDCADAGLKRMPIRDWVDTVKQRSAVEPLPFAPYLFWWDTDAAAPEDKCVKVKQAKTARRLAGHGLREPHIDGETWQRYLGAILVAEGMAARWKKRGIFG